jgi:hypothetical protein
MHQALLTTQARLQEAVGSGKHIEVIPKHLFTAMFMPHMALCAI